MRTPAWWAGRGCGALAVMACLSGCGGSGDDDAADKDAGPTCPTTDVRTILLTGVTPARAASVQNTAIAHSYQTVGFDAHFKDIALTPLANHTAGAIPALVPTATPVARADGSGNDWVYSFTITWPTAPGHVALTDPRQYVDPSDGCVLQLPSPLFEYDITP